MTPATKQDAKPKGKPHTRRKRKPETLCGRPTRKCECGHHKTDHAGKTGRCWQCGEKCEAFKARPCTQQKMKNGCCKMHGGLTPEGIASASWKTGRWAKSMKHRGLRNNFYAALSDPTLKMLDQDLALVDALLQNAVEHARTGKLVTDKEHARFLKLTGERRAIVEAMGRIERHLGLFTPKAVMATFFAGVVGLFREFVKDPKDLKVIQQRLMLLGDAAMAVGTPIVSGQESGAEA